MTDQREPGTEAKMKRGRAKMRGKRAKLEKQGDAGTEKMSHREGYRDRDKQTQPEVELEGKTKKHRDIYKQTQDKEVQANVAEGLAALANFPDGRSYSASIRTCTAICTAGGGRSSAQQ